LRTFNDVNAQWELGGMQICRTGKAAPDDQLWDGAHVAIPWLVGEVPIMCHLDATKLAAISVCDSDPLANGLQLGLHAAHTKAKHRDDAPLQGRPLLKELGVITDLRLAGKVAKGGDSAFAPQETTLVHCSAFGQGREQFGAVGG
jgi:hypothetical protein